MIMRAILEHMMIDRVGDNGTFTQNLNAFEREGYIGKKQVKVVESTLEVGHASIHRSYTPYKDDLITLTDILETILKTIYIHGPQTEELDKRIPKRKSRPTQK
jgi:hypothetical protein